MFGSEHKIELARFAGFEGADFKLEGGARFVPQLLGDVFEDHHVGGVAGAGVGELDRNAMLPTDQDFAPRGGDDLELRLRARTRLEAWVVNDTRATLPRLPSAVGATSISTSRASPEASVPSRQTSSPFCCSAVGEVFTSREPAGTWSISITSSAGCSPTLRTRVMNLQTAPNLGGGGGEFF